MSGPETEGRCLYSRAQRNLSYTKALEDRPRSSARLNTIWRAARGTTRRKASFAAPGESCKSGMGKVGTCEVCGRELSRIAGQISSSGRFAVRRRSTVLVAASSLAATALIATVLVAKTLVATALVAKALVATALVAKTLFAAALVAAALVAVAA